MKGRVCAISGAGSGLGYETALALARRGATVVLLCRSMRRRARPSSRSSRDAGDQRRLWEASAALLGA